ncbi:hypothetical protein T01_6304 [Trichinella spiralis]|uniref:Uncharacterized protein n=1 Tax=Trichinella spiralis TaxID=6334 RepID=A0A0V1AXN5_TRISP|nr:hypothetical protein T01_6304 [Trichinella spiralis]
MLMAECEEGEQYNMFHSNDKAVNFSLAFDKDKQFQDIKTGDLEPRLAVAWRLMATDVSATDFHSSNDNNRISTL